MHSGEGSMDAREQARGRMGFGTLRFRATGEGELYDPQRPAKDVGHPSRVGDLILLAARSRHLSPWPTFSKCPFGEFQARGIPPDPRLWHTGALTSAPVIGRCAGQRASQGTVTNPPCRPSFRASKLAAKVANQFFSVRSLELHPSAGVV